MFRDKLHESSEFRQISGQAREAKQQADNPVPAEVQPVVSLEKTDIEFWMQVAIVVLLFLIYRELARANGHAAIAGLARGAGNA